MIQKYSNTSYLNTLLTDFIALLYPELCIGCGNAMKQREHLICSSCSIDLPHTHFEHLKDNPVEKLFWYKTKIEAATSGYFFSKKSRIQKMIHSFKYKGNQESAIFLGEKLGEMLKSSARFTSIDAIIPVPLHPSKLKKRGYNQAERISIGISNVLKIPVITNSLIRNHYNDTQTNKGLFNRWENVNSVFSIKEPKNIANKHLLIIDDVITSGATIEACAQKVLSVKNTKVSLASLALATG